LFLCEKCDFDVKDFRNYLLYNKLDPRYNKDLLYIDNNNKLSICQQCPHENCDCIVALILKEKFPND